MRVTSATQTSAKDPVVDTAPAQQPNGASVLATASVDVFHGLSMPHAFAASPLAVNSGPTSERLKEWQAWQQSTLRIIDGLGRRLDPDIVPVVTGLNALGINTTMSCEGHLTPRSHPSPMVEVGAHHELFHMRFEGQRELFENKLREISVPFQVRIEKFFTVGFSALTPTTLLAIDTPELRRSHPEFWGKIGKAHMDSLQQAAYRTHPVASPFTPEEQVRRAIIAELLAKVTALVDEFNSGRADGDLHKPLIRAYEGESFELVFGHHPEEMPRDGALLKERQAVAADFGRFLHNKFLLA